MPIDPTIDRHRSPLTICTTALVFFPTATNLLDRKETSFKDCKHLVRRLVPWKLCRTGWGMISLHQLHRKIVIRTAPLILAQAAARVFETWRGKNEEEHETNTVKVYSVPLAWLYL